MKIKNLSSAFLLLSSFGAFAQTNTYSKLEIKKNEVFKVGPTNMLLVDTLIMHDKATIQFSPEVKGILQSNVAYVGNNCTVTSRGLNGINYTSKTMGTPGQDGGSLDIILHFERLGKLTIDTRGGRGGDGMKGKDGAKGAPDRIEERSVVGPDGKYTTVRVVIPAQLGSDGTSATTGFTGGNGGDVQLSYSTNDFIPVFNNAEAKNGILLLTTAGAYGRDGQPGRGGLGRMDGKLVQLENEKPQDGKVELVNVNSLSVQE
ncbi:hypothetical protein WG947_03955 [Pontibacter sp. H259]|uniref:hypothetical protein n=1 Tax=Pontibacter sp. H259 TaxID=3133421 RepID=UPI0030BF8D4E